MNRGPNIKKERTLFHLVLLELRTGQKDVALMVGGGREVQDLPVWVFLLSGGQTTTQIEKSSERRPPAQSWTAGPPL